MLIGALGLAHLTPLFFELETVIPLTVLEKRPLKELNGGGAH